MDSLLALIVAIAIIVVISLISIKIGWALFVVPVFGLPNLTWLQALGFALLTSCFRSSSSSSK